MGLRRNRAANYLKRLQIKAYLAIKKVKYEVLPGINGHIIISCEKMNELEITYPRIILGKGISINSGYYKNLIGRGICTIFRTIDNGRIVIGNNVKMSNVAIVSMKEIIIEDNVLIGGGVTIWDTDFHSLDFETRIYNPYMDICSKEVRIKEGAFIGAGVYILKGVSIGKESIVAAGSVVKRSIPDYEMWGGNPARCIKKSLKAKPEN